MSGRAKRLTTCSACVATSTCASSSLLTGTLSPVVRHALSTYSLLVCTDAHLQDIKDRYYAVTKRILEHRHPLADPDTKARIAALAFNKGTLNCSMICLIFVERELQRKAAIERFNARSVDELREEEELIMQCRNVAANLDQLLRDRRHILSVMKPQSVPGPMITTLATSEFGPDGTGDVAKWKNKKKIKKKTGPDVQKPATFTLSGSGADSDSSVLPALSVKKDKRVAGVFVRSQIMSNVIKNQNVLQKVQAVLLEYGLSNPSPIHSSLIFFSVTSENANVICMRPIRRRHSKYHHHA